MADGQRTDTYCILYRIDDERRAVTWPMTPNTHALYLKDVGYLMRERAVEATEEKRRNESNHYAQCRATALYEVASLMRDQAKAFDLDLASSRAPAQDVPQCAVGSYGCFVGSVPSIGLGEQ